MSTIKPWASFCMSTYNRPTFLKTQIEVLLKQSFKNFEIVIADNDPNASGKAVADLFNDERVKYECNVENLGMVKSFNRSIDRAEGEFVVMITDDDPVHTNMLEFFYNLSQQYPNSSLYSGVIRKNKSQGSIEQIEASIFPFELLDPNKTIALHWSSSLLKRSTLLKIGKLTDFGSGHLVDHIMLTMMGIDNGAILVNQEFSHIQLHESNYSKGNYNNYYVSCVGFYDTLTTHFKVSNNEIAIQNIVIKHLHYWFITCFFSLRKFYTMGNPKNLKEIISDIDKIANKIMELPYMKKCASKYFLKKNIFYIKNKLKLLK